MNGCLLSRLSILLLAILPGGSVLAQEPGALPAGMSSQAGVDAASGFAYALIAVEGRLPGAGAAASEPAPRLIAQCSKDTAGKSRFELLADEPGSEGGGAMTFQPPWKPVKGELFAPSLAKVIVTMEFLGYVKVKPVKRQWEYPFGSVGLIRYSAPGRASSNMEEPMYYLRYLGSLPVLRLTVTGKRPVEFETKQWLAAVKAEPLCRASGL